MKKKTANRPKLVAKATAVAPVKARRRKNSSRSNGIGRPPLDDDEHHRGERGDREQQRNPPRAEAGVLALDHRERERRHRDRAGDEAR